MRHLKGLARAVLANDYVMVAGFFVAALLMVGAAAIVAWLVFG